MRVENRTYTKDNIITIGRDAPMHLLTYWMGILRGMGIVHKLDPESPLYRILREAHTEKYRELLAAREIKDELPFEFGYRVYHEGGNADDISVKVTPIYDVTVDASAEWLSAPTDAEVLHAPPTRRPALKPRVEPESKDKLILLGQGPSRHNCPFDAEVWATVTALGHEEYADKPFSKVFCFDVPERKLDELAGMKVAQARGIPIVSGKQFSYATEAYPSRGVAVRFESFFFLSDMSYMLAMALYLGYKSLLLWGVDQSDYEIYKLGRKYVTYWLGVATGMGVPWELAPDSVLWREGD